VCVCAEIQIWIKLAILPFLWKNFSIHNQTSSADCVCVCVCVQKYRFGLSWPSCLFSGRIFQFTIRLPVNQTSSADCVCVCVQKYRFGLSWPSCLFSGRIFQFTIRLPVQIIVTEKGAETCCYSESSFLFFFNQ